MTTPPDAGGVAHPVGGREVGTVELVAILAALTATSSLAIDCVLPAMPGIGASLRVSGNRMQVLVSSFVVASGFGALLCGPLADRYGRRAPLVSASLGFAVAAALCGLAQSFPMLIALRVVQGLAGATMMVLPMSVIRDRFSGDQMARMMSLVVVTFGVVPLFAPTLGLVVYDRVGWRWLFLLLGALALGLAGWLWVRLPETLGADRRNAIGVGPLVRAWGEIFRNRAAVSYILAQTILMGATYAYVFSGQQIVAQHFGRPQAFGIVFALVGVGATAASLTNSALVVRFGARRISSLATVLFTVAGLGQILFARALPGSLVAFVAALMASQAFIGLSSSNFGALAMQDLGRLAGVASGLIGFARLVLGGLVGAVIGAGYDGTAAPLGCGYLVCGLAVLACVGAARTSACAATTPSPVASRTGGTAGDREAGALVEQAIAVSPPAHPRRPA